MAGTRLDTIAIRTAQRVEVATVLQQEKSIKTAQRKVREQRGNDFMGVHDLIAVDGVLVDFSRSQ